MKTYAELDAPRKSQVVDLFCKAMGYEDVVEKEVEVDVLDDEQKPTGEKVLKVELVPNPESKARFFNRLTGEYPVRVAMSEMARQQAEQASEHFN